MRHGVRYGLVRVGGFGPATVIASVAVAVPVPGGTSEMVTVTVSCPDVA